MLLLYEIENDWGDSLVEGYSFIRRGRRRTRGDGSDHNTANALV